MNFEAVMINSGQPLLVRIVRELSDGVGSAFEKVSGLAASPSSSCLRAKSRDSNPDGLFVSLPSHPSLIRSICQGVSEVFSADHTEPPSAPAEGVSRFGPLVAVTEEALPMRLFKAAQSAFSQIDERSEFEQDVTTVERGYADLPFLRETAAPPFPVRLAREAAEAARTFASDPATFIRGLAAGGEA